MAESNTFKYLSDAQSSNAATEFLQKQLGKNKYTSGDPYAYGEGATPGGEGYRDQLKVTNQDEIDQWHKDNPDGGGAAKGDWSAIPIKGYGKTRYEKGQWGAGKHSAEELREKFGLSDDESAASGERAIYGYNQDGTKVFIGAVTGDLKGNSELLSAHSAQKHPDELSHDGQLSSDGDVKGAILNLWKAEAGEAKEPPKPKFKMDPIKHSPEINQAKERVKNYEQDVMSGKTSQEIYGKGEQLADDKYVFDATKGAAGIGASPVSASQKGASDATQSFLNNKVSQVKKTLSPV